MSESFIVFRESEVLLFSRRARAVTSWPLRAELQRALHDLQQLSVERKAAAKLAVTSSFRFSERLVLVSRRCVMVNLSEAAFRIRYATIEDEGTVKVCIFFLFSSSG